MAKIIVTRGLPGVGKSTFAKHYQAMNAPVVIAERDGIRKELNGTGKPGESEFESKVTDIQHKRVKWSLREGLNVVVSDTHLPDRSVKIWMQIAHEMGAEVEVVDFRAVPLTDVLEANAKRYDTEKYIPVSVIMEKHERFIKGRDLGAPVQFTPKVAKASNFVSRKYKQGTGPQTYLFDMDGTLALNTSGREWHDGAKAHLDTVNVDVWRVLQDLYKKGNDIIIVTARGAEHLDITKQWLGFHGVPYSNIFSRKAGDKRDDFLIKHELFWENIAPMERYIAGVFDDRQCVVDMWRDMGLTCFQVAPGNF